LPNHIVSYQVFLVPTACRNVFKNIDFPAVGPPVIAGLLLIFALSINEGSVQTPHQPGLKVICQAYFLAQAICLSQEILEQIFRVSHCAGQAAGQSIQAGNVRLQDSFKIADQLTSLKNITWIHFALHSRIVAKPSFSDLAIFVLFLLESEKLLSIKNQYFMEPIQTFKRYTQ